MRNPFFTYTTIILLTLHGLELMHCQLGFTPSSAIVDPREYFLSPDAHDLPHMPRRHFSPSPLHLAASFFQVILRRAVRVIWSQD